MDYRGRECWCFALWAQKLWTWTHTWNLELHQNCFHILLISLANFRMFYKLHLAHLKETYEAHFQVCKFVLGYGNKRSVNRSTHQFSHVVQCHSSVFPPLSETLRLSSCLFKAPWIPSLFWLVSSDMPDPANYMAFIMQMCDMVPRRLMRNFGNSVFYWKDEPLLVGWPFFNF